MNETHLRDCVDRVDRLVEENRCSLHQLETLLLEITPLAYRHGFDAEGRQTLGRHVRHILDHYRALLEGIDGSCIDYEARVRESELEQEPAVALEWLGQIRARLTMLGEHASTPLQLKYPIDEEGEALLLTTSLARELAFLTSHTVHHMALLRVLAQQLGVKLPADFGVHPSTLRHWRRQAMEDKDSPSVLHGSDALRKVRGFMDLS
ncbi:DinB family protein [uncultured Halomonas sp.]|uniref:DinB family protein n=1 Tax=uncultured Halomonas sp. TaxID=173971 RepID=UPI00261551BD|nr:DinB family protein [uncultured Halomonas sp.]